MGYLKLFLTIFALVAVIQVGESQDEKETPSALQKGMDPIFEINHNFLTTVMPFNFYEKSAENFNKDDLIQIIKENDYSKVQEDWQKLSRTFGGFAACIIMGLIFMVFMPLAGCIWCCCRCCCTKKQTMDPKRATCKRATYTSLLLVFTTLMLAGGIITFLSSELLHRSLKNDNEDGLIGRLEGNLQTLNTFVNSTIEEVKKIAQDQVIRDGFGKILPTIVAAANTTVDKVKNTINATTLLDQSDKIGNDAKEVLKDLKAVNSSLQDLKGLQENVTTTLNDIQAKLNGICSGNTCDSFITLQEIDQLTFNPDFTALDDLASQISQVEKSQDIDSTVQEAHDQFNDAYSKINSEVQSVTDQASTSVNDLNTTTSEQLDNIDKNLDEFTKPVDNAKSSFQDADENITKVGNYIWYGCIGVGCAVLLVVFFYYMGVLFGLCGERPGYNAACCNRGTGATLLCTGICFSFLFCWILMLVVIITFSIGGLSYTLGCQYLANGIENIQTLESVVTDGFDMNVSSALGVKNLTIAGMFQSCKNNEGLYRAFRLESKFNLDELVNITNVLEEVRQMADKSVLNVNNITILSPEMERQLRNFSAYSIPNTTFQEYWTQLNRNVTVDLNVYITKLRNGAASMNSNDVHRTELNETANKLESLQNNQIKEVDTIKANLSANLMKLQQDNDVSSQINSLIVNIRASEDEFNTRKDDIIKEGLQQAANTIINFINTTAVNVTEAVKNAGRCKPLYDAVQNLADGVCKVTLDPFNGVWFGLGWSLFFYIPSFIFAALLVSLYNRSERYEKKDNGFDDPNLDAYQGYDGYRNGRDDIPLTRRHGGHDYQGQANGARNYAYEGRNQDDVAYHRSNSEPGSPYNKPTYAQPYQESRDRGGYDAPPHYDVAVSRGSHFDHHGQRRGNMGR